MKIAISGKGGSGKTTIAGTLARSFADDGLEVVALDDDDNPNLAGTLGIPSDERVHPLPVKLIKRVETEEGVSFELARPAEQVLEDHAARAPGGVRLLKMGEVNEPAQGCFCSRHAATNVVLGQRETSTDRITIADMVAGVEHLSRGTAEDVDLMLVVVEPFYKSLETGRRTKELAEGLGIPEVRVVANKVHDERDEEAIADFCKRHGLTIEATVPFGEGIRRADQDETAPFDAAPQSEGVEAIRRLAKRVAPVTG